MYRRGHKKQNKKKAASDIAVIAFGAHHDLIIYWH